MTPSEFKSGLNDVLCRYKRQNPPLSAEIERAVTNYLEEAKQRSETILGLLDNNDTVEVYLLGNEFSIYLPDRLAKWMRGELK